MCLQCSENTTQVNCPKCRALNTAVFPLDANAGLDQIWSYVMARFKEEWLMLTVGILLMGAVGAVGGVFTNIVTEVVKAVLGVKLDPIQPWKNLPDFVKVTGISQFLALFVQLPFQGIALLGMYRLIVDVLHGRKADIGRMFKIMYLLSRYVILQLLVHVVITIPLMMMFALFGFVALRSSGLSLGDFPSNHAVTEFLRSPAPFILVGGSLLFIVITFLVAPITLFAVPELLVSECQPMEAITRAWKLGDGQRLRIFGYSLLSGVIIFVGFLACCVGAIPASGAAYMLLICLFMVIRKGHADLPPVLDK